MRSPNPCPAEHVGPDGSVYYCTESRGHRSPHRTTDAHGVVLAEWAAPRDYRKVGS